MVLRTLAALALIAGCGQSLFDNNVGGGTGDGGNGSGDGSMVASSCPAGCIGDAAADVDGSRPGWRYLEDARNRTWAPMAEAGGSFTGAVAPNAITTCAAKPTAPGCVALPGALLVTTAGMTTAADPAVEFTVPTAQVVQLSARVYVPTGQPAQQVRVYRNSREDVLFTGIAAAGALFERAITIDALAGERVLLAIAPTTMGAADVAVHLYVNSTGAAFPATCTLAVDFASASGNTVGNACGGAATYYDYDLSSPDDDIPPKLTAGPYTQLGMAADIPLTEYYRGTDIIPRTGDSTTQLWVRHDAFDPSYSYNAYPFSDMDLDNGGGIAFSIFETGSLTRGLGIYTCQGSPCTEGGVDFSYPNDANWHFVRVVHTGGELHLCVDGKRAAGSVTVPDGKLQGTYPPHFGRNVKWLTAGAYFDGAVDDVRTFSVALPCE